MKAIEYAKTMYEVRKERPPCSLQNMSMCLEYYLPSRSSFGAHVMVSQF